MKIFSFFNNLIFSKRAGKLMEPKYLTYRQKYKTKKPNPIIIKLYG